MIADPTMDVYLNGSMRKPDQALIGHDDAGLQHGVGLFETMAVFNGKAFRLEAHLGRLARSAAELGLAADLDILRLDQAIKETIAHNQLDRARLRLTLTGGRINLLRAENGYRYRPTVLIVPSDLIEYDTQYFEQGITVQIAGAVANPFDPLAGHKSLDYWARLSLLHRAASVGAGEAILLNVSNHVASGAISNVFIVRDSAMLTPFAHREEVEGGLRAPVLPGITRAAVIELAAQESTPVHNHMLSIEDLLDADEVFLTNSIWQVLSVTKVEQKRIGDGRVGPITQKLRSALLELIERESNLPT